MTCFEKADNFSLLLVALAQKNGAGITGEHKGKLLEYFDRCPQEFKEKNLSALLVFIRLFTSYNEKGRLDEACLLFEQNIDSFAGMPEEQTNMRVEYEFLWSLMEYNDIKEMSKHHRKALAYSKKRIPDQERKGNWTFGSPSVLLMFYRTSGELTSHVEDMKESMPYYRQLSEGHGSGAEYVMEAEVALNRGELEKAERIIHKALHYARGKEQWSILLAASFVQIRLALVRGDYFEAMYLKKNMFELMEVNRQYLLLHTLDICESYFFLLLNLPEKTVGWIKNGDYSNTRLMFPALPALYIVYGRYLLLSGEYQKLIGMSDVFLQVNSVYPNLIGQIYTYIYLAIVYHKLAEKEAALVTLEKALAIALPDGLYLPFAENGSVLADLLKQLSSQEQYSNHVKQIFALHKKNEQGIKKILQTHFAETKPSLTKRENDVAVLAAVGMCNRDIAQNLMISENTVKSRLKQVFEKLSIKSRAQLQEKLKKE